MTKNWIIDVRDGNGKEFNLYVATSDESVRADLALPSYQSLIHTGRHLVSRHLRSSEVTNETDHMDLAIGAFFIHANGRGLTTGELRLVNIIPDGLAEFWLGGDENGFLVQVYSESQ